MGCIKYNYLSEAQISVCCLLKVNLSLYKKPRFAICIKSNLDFVVTKCSAVVNISYIA